MATSAQFAAYLTGRGITIFNYLNRTDGVGQQRLIDDFMAKQPGVLKTAPSRNQIAKDLAAQAGILDRPDQDYLDFYDFLTRKGIEPTTFGGLNTAQKNQLQSEFGKQQPGIFKTTPSVNALASGMNTTKTYLQSLTAGMQTGGGNFGPALGPPKPPLGPPAPPTAAATSQNVWAGANTEGSSSARSVPTTPEGVKALQAELNAQGFTDQQGKPLKVDGIMGPRTKAALAKRDGGQPAGAPAGGGGGGRGGGGGGGGGTTVAPATAPAKPVDPTQFARETYGYLAYFLDDPEIGAFLHQAAEKGWSKEVMQGELFKTQWWQKQAETTRNWLVLQKTDPATAEWQIANKTQELTNRASVLGIGLTPDRARQIATDALRYGWTDTQLQTALASEINFAGLQVGGVRGLMQDLTQATTDYLVPISDPTLQSWTKQIIGGTQTEENFRTYLIDQAKSLFPYLANALDTGLSVRQYVDPYVQMAAKTLELNPADIDLTQAKWLAPLQRVDPQTGERGVMSLSDWDREMRMNPTYGYDRTQGARDQAAQIASDLSRMFGRVG